MTTQNTISKCIRTYNSKEGNLLFIIGLGYVGLPTVIMVAKSGRKVIGTDLKKELVSSLYNNEITFDENGLEEHFKDAIENKIKFSTQYQKTNIYIKLFQPHFFRKQEISP